VALDTGPSLQFPKYHALSKPCVFHSDEKESGGVDCNSESNVSRSDEIVRNLADGFGAVTRNQPSTDRVFVHPREEPGREKNVQHRQGYAERE
jgi:hypothetical protein